MAIRDFRDLDVWQQAVELSAAIYSLTRRYPADERFGITLQLRNAAVSVSSNIAEGNGRGTVKDYIRFLMTSQGSLNEVISLLAVSCRVGIVKQADTKPVEDLAERVGQMLMALRRSLLKKAASRR